MKMLSPVLWTKNLKETVTFYEEVLGFCANTGSFPNFVSLCRENVEIMFIVPQPEPGQEGEFFLKPKLTGNLYIVMQEVDKLWDQLKEKATIKTAIGDREYHLRDFSILDNNGYELVFGEHISR